MRYKKIMWKEIEREVKWKQAWMQKCNITFIIFTHVLDKSLHWESWWWAVQRIIYVTHFIQSEEIPSNISSVKMRISHLGCKGVLETFPNQISESFQIFSYSVWPDFKDFQIFVNFFITLRISPYSRDSTNRVLYRQRRMYSWCDQNLRVLKIW